jgi:hypothetical protein
MKKLIQIGFAGLAVLLMAQTAVVGQERGERGGRGQGNFDPEQMRERMMERYQQTLGFNDQEWRAIRPMLEKVLEKQRELAPLGRGGMMGFGGPGGPGGPGFAGRGGGPGGPAAGGAGGGGGFRGGRGADSPEREALQRAVENGTPSEIQAKLKDFREARESKEKELQETRERLRKVVNAKQEASLVIAGLLD